MTLCLIRQIWAPLGEAAKKPEKILRLSLLSSSAKNL